jgi:hypothetical protein
MPLCQRRRTRTYSQPPPHPRNRPPSVSITCHPPTIIQSKIGDPFGFVPQRALAVAPLATAEAAEPGGQARRGRSAGRWVTRLWLAVRVLPRPVLASPISGGPILAGPVLASPSLAGRIPACPVLANPLLMGRILAGPVLASAILVGAVLASPVPASPVSAGAVLAGPVPASPISAGAVLAGPVAAGRVLTARPAAESPRLGHQAFLNAGHARLAQPCRR